MLDSFLLSPETRCGILPSNAVLAVVFMGFNMNFLTGSASITMAARVHCWGQASRSGTPGIAVPKRLDLAEC
jgi:hypothetical protein